MTFDEKVEKLTCYYRLNEEQISYAEHERKARERAEKDAAASNERAQRFDAAFRSLDVDLAATLRAIGEAPMDIMQQIKDGELEVPDE